MLLLLLLLHDELLVLDQLLLLHKHLLHHHLHVLRTPLLLHVCWLIHATHASWIKSSTELRLCLHLEGWLLLLLRRGLRSNYLLLGSLRVTSAGGGARQVNLFLL